MRTSRFDELNNIERKNISIEDYFNDMSLTESEKAERIKMAYEMWDMLDDMFLLFSTFIQTEFISRQYFIEQLNTRFRNIAGKYSELDDYLDDFILLSSEEIVDGILKNIEDGYMLSNDKALLLAEEQTNSVMNYEDYQVALASGKTTKKWLTMKDRFVRHSHVMVDDEEIPINAYFTVGSSLMRYPRDRKGAMCEIAGCRCSIKYF